MNINTALPEKGKVNSKTQQTYSLQDRFLSLLERHAQRLTVRSNRASGLCPFHQEQTPSFSADVERCIWHCFGCGAGGGVKKFAQLVGEEWTSPQRRDPKAQARRAALQTTHETFRDWYRRKMIALTDEYREDLPLELDIAEIAYRSIHRWPSLLSEEEERWWKKRLAKIYDRRAILEYWLDLLTYQQNELSCVKWWRNEMQEKETDATRDAA